MSTKGRQTTAFLPHYLLVEIALTLVCSSRPSNAIKIKSMVMFLETLLKFYMKRQLIFNILKHSKYTILRFETFRRKLPTLEALKVVPFCPRRCSGEWVWFTQCLAIERKKQQQQQKAANQRNTFQLKILKNVRR